MVVNPNPINIVWLSRHTPTPCQLRELRRLFPSHHLRVDTRSFSGADEIVSRFHAMHGDEMVVVAPLSVIRELCNRGLRPLWAEMRVVSAQSKDAEVISGGRGYQFIRFRRIRSVTLELVDLEKTPTPTDAPSSPESTNSGSPKLRIVKPNEDVA